MTNKEAIEILKKYKDESEEDYYVKRAEALEKGIEALECQKIGHWIRQMGAYGLADTCECSVCGRTIYAGNENDLKDYPYCHCGAKMEGEK